MGWWIALGILLLIGAIPLGVDVRYREAGLLVRWVLGPLRGTVYPRKQKKPKRERKKTPEPPKTENPAKPPEPQVDRQPPPQTAEAPPGEDTEKGGSIRDFLPLARVGADMLNGLRRRLRVDRLELCVTLAGEDPCDLAENYGRAWAALGNLVPRLDRWFVIKKRDLEVQCDFTSEETTVFARLKLTITLGRVLSLGVVCGTRALITFIKIWKNNKGGAQNEPETSQYAGDHHPENP